MVKVSLSLFGLLLATALLSACGNLGVSLDTNADYRGKNINGNNGDGNGEDDDDDDEGDGGGNDGDLNNDGEWDADVEFPNSCHPARPDGGRWRRHSSGVRYGQCTFGILVENLAQCEAVYGSWLWYCNVNIPEGYDTDYRGWICCGII